MCYSAQVIHEYRLFTREYGAVLSLKEFFDIYWGSSQNSDRKVRQAGVRGAMEQKTALSHVDIYRHAFVGAVRNEEPGSELHLGRSWPPWTSHPYETWCGLSQTSCLSCCF